MIKKTNDNIKTQTFCTIITEDYFPKAAVLYQSLFDLDENVALKIFVSDGPINISTKQWPGISFLIKENINDLPLVDEIYDKYAQTNKDQFRWALKPLLMLYLLEQGFDKVIFVDCDLYFVNDYQFLFNYLDDAAMLLSPHWNCADPTIYEQSFLSTFIYGLYNAGFVGGSKKGIPALRWWAEACHYKMGEHNDLGIFDDQRYLDAIPTFFEDVQIIHHRGCNVASWNFEACKRVAVNGEILINGKYPIIFFHFNHMLVKEILKGHDSLLRPYFDTYNNLYSNAGFSLSYFLTDLKKYTDRSVLMEIKWHLRIRTRIKKLLFHFVKKM